MQFSRLLRSSPYLLVESLKSKNIFTRRKQVLDAVHANKLQTALGHLGLFSNPTLKLGEPLPPCYHLVYFTPDALETELGPDGADKTFNPGEPFTRRLWSGGSMSWEQHNPMRLGQTIEEVTTLDRVESKQTRNRKSMIVVTAKKQYSNDTGLCLTDLRSWLFLEPNEQMPTRRSFAPHEILHGTTVGSISATEVTLFRYSALTFNSHKIHYDRVWARDVERQGDLVVHGPLNSL